MTAHMPNGNLFLVVIVCLTMLQQKYVKFWERKILCLITMILYFQSLQNRIFSNTFLSLYNTTTLDMIITIVGISPPEMHRNAIYAIASVSSSDHVGRQLQFEVSTDTCLA